MKLSIRALAPEDREAFVDLTAHRPGYTRTQAERRTDLVFHIAFKNPTSDGGPHYFVATDGPRLMCHMGRMPTRFYVEGKPHVASFAHDLFAHPELQATGAGFFTTMKLYKAVEDTCPSFCALLWTNDINVKLQQTRKYDQLWVERWGRPLHADSAVDRVLAHTPQLVRSVARTAARLGLMAADLALERALARVGVERIIQPDERFDRFAEVVGPRLGTAPIKDRRYVKWHYFDWPGLRTAVFGVPGGSTGLRGFVVLREPESVKDPGRILDLVVDPDDDAALATLIAAAVRHFRDKGLSRVECMATFPPTARGLKKFLFVQRPPPTPLFFLNGHKAPNVEVLRRVENWSHAFGDSEGGEVP